MNAVKNKVQLIGNLGQDPEIKKIGDDKKVAHLNVATNENYKNAKGEKVSETQWHNVIAWGKQGVKRYITEIQANELLILSKK